MVVRKTFRTLKDSCYTQLKWAINRLGMADYWDCKESPLEMTYRPTGQKIYFRGLDDPLKITSITVEHGFLCWGWIEEAYEIFKEADFNTLDEGLRGALPPGLFKQWTLTFNPWNSRHWTKKRFFDRPKENTLALTTDYRCNEFLDDADRALFEEMRTRDPKRYKVAGLGAWGTDEGLIYDKWDIKDFSTEEISAQPGVRSVFGLDFGYTNDPTALFCGLYDKPNRRLYVFDELYRKALINRKIAEAVKQMGYAKEHITADGAEPKSIAELREYGLSRVRGSQKGKDSVRSGIQFIQGLEIIIAPRCVNFITEISNYTWATDRAGTLTNEPIDYFNHLLDAMRYALEDQIVNSRIEGALIDL